jgi:hypothetical protein
MLAGSGVTFLVPVRSSDMRRIFVLAAVSAAAVLGSPGPAGAELVALGPGVPVGSDWPVAAGPDGRALAIVPGPFCEGCNDGRVAERARSGRWILRAIMPPGMFPAFVAWGPGAAATALGVADASAGTGGADAFVLRRPAAAEGFGVPVRIALGGPIWDKWHVASDARGDVAFITAVMGPDSIVRTVLVTAAHATTRPAGSARFGPLHVISKLGEGGSPSVALLSDRRPLVVYRGHRGELLATTRLTGPSPDLAPPRLVIKFASDALNELRATNAVTVTVRCSKPCMLQTRASLHTDDGRTVADGVDRKILRRGATFTERFTFNPDRRAGRARDGARVRVTVAAQNASGALGEAVKQIKL